MKNKLTTKPEPEEVFETFNKSKPTEEERIKTLTIRLKRMSGSESDYGEIWDERVKLIRKLNQSI